jgi:hypothetical protein
MEESIILSIEKIYEICFIIDDKLSYHLEKLESGYSGVKNLNPFSKLGFSFHMLFLFFFKLFLYRITYYINKNVTDSYVEEKEYNLFITIIAIISFNLTNISIFRQNSIKLLNQRKRIGIWIFKLLIDIINTYKIYYFFTKFSFLHFELFTNIENNDKYNIIEKITKILFYFMTDFLLVNTTSTSSRLISFCLIKESRSKIIRDFQRKFFIFSLRFFMFYLILFKKFLDNFQVFELRQINNSSNLAFLLCNFVFSRIE